MLRLASWGLSFGLALITASAVCAQGLSSLDGEWKPVSGVLHGQQVPSAALSVMKLKLTNGAFYAESGGIISSGSVIMEAGASNVIRFSITSGEDVGRNLPALYRLDGNRLTIAFSETGSAPTSFDSNDGNRYLVMVYEKTAIQEGPPVASSGGPTSNSVVD